MKYIIYLENNLSIKCNKIAKEGNFIKCFVGDQEILKISLGAFSLKMESKGKYYYIFKVLKK